MGSEEDDTHFDCLAEDEGDEEGKFMKWIMKFGKQYKNGTEWKQKLKNWIRNNGTIKW